MARFVGKYQASTDADGYDSNGDVDLQIVRPEGATGVTAAYLTSLSALDDGAYDPPTTTLDGDAVTYSYRTDYGGYANHLADVTTIVSDFLDGATARNADFTSPFSGETDSDLFDIAGTLETTTGLSGGAPSTPYQTQYQGLMLTVVFEDPTQADDSTVIIMFGNAAASPEQQTKLSFTELTTDAPAESWLAVGIAWSFNGPTEISTIEASTNIASRPDCSANPSAAGCITKTAGGYDDGQDPPLQLVTYGGVGDDRVNGYGTVTQATDDEFYNIDGLLKTGASEVTLYSSNTSNNDNFGMLTVYLPFASNPEIIFDAKGGTGSMANQSSAVQAAITANAFERTGYTFAGWEDSAGNFYSNQATYSFTSSTTLFAQWTENREPVPYSGPIITDIGEDNLASPYQTYGGQTVRVDGERLSTVSRVFVDRKEGEVLSAIEDHFIMIVPLGITSGTYDLVVNSALGNLTYLDGFIVSSESESVSAANAVCDGVEPSWWTQRISDTQAKAYIKCPAVGQKYRILQQTGGSGDYTSIFAKTLTDENDTTQLFNEFGRYVVRTIDLEDINRIRIRIDDEEAWKVRYNN